MSLVLPKTLDKSKFSIMFTGGRLPLQGPGKVYFKSRYRGVCVGTLVARSVVLTAAVCITSHLTLEHDRRPITVVAGASYRHPRRGIRVQVTKILLPNLADKTVNKAYLMQNSAAVLILKRQIPDAFVEIPLRPIDVDWKGEEELVLQEECFMPGWHFFYKGDPVYPIYSFLLQRYLRVQFLNVAKKSMWCDPLVMRMQQVLSFLGVFDFYDTKSYICIKDPDRSAQPCHGMYGAPLVCRGRMVGMLMAPDMQWSNCTGFSNIVHVLNSRFLSKFMECVSRLFETTEHKDWATMKKHILNDSYGDHYDYVPSMYDRLAWDSSSSETEEE